MINPNDNDLPGYLQPWIGVIPDKQLQQGAQAAREHQQAQATRAAEQSNGHQPQGNGQPATQEEEYNPWD